jgi:hypothetical protein
MEIARKHWRHGLAALALSWAAAASGQVTLRLSAPAVVTVGSSFTLALSAEGLGAAGDTLALGAYDLDLLLDAARVSFVSVSFGDSGGHSGLDAGVGGSLTAFDASDPGRLTLREISFEAASALTTAQPASFTLLSIQLTALAPGVWAPQLDAITLSDQDGLALTAWVVGPGVTISAVPEPGSAPLCLVGLIGLAGLALARRADRSQR